MNVDAAGLERGPGHIARVMGAGFFKARDQFRRVLVVFQRFEAPDAHAVGFHGDSHGPVEVSEVGVDLIAFAAHQDEFSGLVGGNRQADAQLFQDIRQVAGKNAAKVLSDRWMIRVFVVHGFLLKSPSPWKSLSGSVIPACSFRQFSKRKYHKNLIYFFINLNQPIYLLSSSTMRILPFRTSAGSGVLTSSSFSAPGTRSAWLAERTSRGSAFRIRFRPPNSHNF